MIEGITIVGLLLYITYREYQTGKERDKFIRAIMSKNLTEYTSSAIMNKETKEDKPVEFIPADQASDKEFDKMIKSQLAEPEPVVNTLKEKLTAKLFKKNGI